MKIILLHKSLVIGGIETVLVTYLNIFHSLGHEVDLYLNYDLEQENSRIRDIHKDIDIAFSLNKDSFYKLQQKRETRKLSIFHKISYEMLKYFHKRKFNKDILSILKYNNYDLVIDFSGCLDIKNKELKEFGNATFIRWCHSQIPNREITKTINTYKAFDKIVFVSAEMRNNLLSKSIKLRNKVDFLHNPIDIKEITRKSKLTIPEKLDEEYFIFVGRIAPQKGLIELIDIYSILKSKYNIKNKLYLIGEGDYYIPLIEYITKKELKEDCILLGKRENPYPYMKNAKLFLFTSETEGLPTVLIESMALGTPVIAMDCITGPAEILGKHNEFGKLVALHDKETFCNVTYEMISDSCLYKHYKSKSIVRSMDFSLEMTEQKIKNFIADLSK